MKGVIFNIFEAFLQKAIAPSSWLEVLDRDGKSDRVYVGPKTYEDKEFLGLVGRAVELYKLPLGDTVKAFGKFTFPQLVRKLPNVVNQYHTPEELLLALDGIIHVEVRKLLSNANTPKFNVVRLSPTSVRVEYISERKLCKLAEGIFEGVAEHYGRDLVATKHKCLNSGDSCCEYVLEFKDKV